MRWVLVALVVILVALTVFQAPKGNLRTARKGVSVFTPVVFPDDTAISMDYADIVAAYMPSPAAMSQIMSNEKVEKGENEWPSTNGGKWPGEPGYDPNYKVPDSLLYATVAPGPTGVPTLDPRAVSSMINSTEVIIDANIWARQFTPLKIDAGKMVTLIEGQGVKKSRIEFMTLALDKMLPTRGSAGFVDYNPDLIRIFYACSLDVTDFSGYEQKAGLPNGYFGDAKDLCNYVLLHEVAHAVDMLQKGKAAADAQVEARADALAKEWFDAGERLIVF